MLILMNAREREYIIMLAYNAYESSVSLLRMLSVENSKVHILREFVWSIPSKSHTCWPNPSCSWTLIRIVKAAESSMTTAMY